MNIRASAVLALPIRRAGLGSIQSYQRIRLVLSDPVRKGVTGGACRGAFLLPSIVHNRRDMRILQLLEREFVRLSRRNFSEAHAINDKGQIIAMGEGDREITIDKASSATAHEDCAPGASVHVFAHACLDT